MLGVDTGKLEELLDRLESVADKQLEAAQIIAQATDEFGVHVADLGRLERLKREFSN